MSFETMFPPVQEPPQQAPQTPPQPQVIHPQVQPPQPVQQVQAAPTGYVDPSQIQVQSPYYNDTMRPFDLEDYEEQMWDVIDNFEKKAWSDQNEGIKTGWPEFDAKLDGGFKVGWVLIGGGSNIGKTSFLSLMGWQIANQNKDVFVLDFSLDDPMQDKIPRIVAASNKVLINAVSRPKSFENMPDMLKRRKKGIDVLRNATDRYKVYDANHGSDIDEIERTIRAMKTNLEEEAMKKGVEPKRLVVMIDNFHDLTTTARESQGSDKQKYDYLAQRVSDMATMHEITLITTGELKKLNGFRRPTKEDLRESIKIVYEAKMILLCYNEVGEKGDNAAVYYDRHGAASRQPVFEIHFDKNKMSSFKGRMFFEFYPEIAYFEPADKQASQRYSSLIYSS